MTDGRVLIGEVIEFDEVSGLGAVGSDHGGRFPFHCVEIADGTRTIAIGAPVAFMLLAKLGESEAAAITVRV